MEIICDQCERKLKISDEKIPEGRKVTLTCPGCKKKLSVEKKPEADDDVSFGFETGDSDTEEEQQSDFGFGLSDEYEQPDKTFEFIEDEGKTVLICEEDKGVKEKIKPVLDFMEYHIVETDNARDAIKRMRYNFFDLMIINEEFDTRDPDSNGVLIYLTRMQMLERRKMFVALLSRRFKTMDHMMALQKSVNLIINLNKLDDIEKIFKHSISDNDMFYRLYMENLRAMGRL
jgi:uncharacterized protein YbaR (Trm112 family)